MMKDQSKVSDIMSKYTTETDKELEAVLVSHKTRIRIVGTGGGGNNTVTRLLEVGIVGVEVVAVNTDAQDLLYAKADHKVLIGKNITNGLGAGSDPQKGEDSAKEATEELENILNDSDLVFVTCGLGGGTGTGSAPIIAELAKKSGALTIAVVTLPFSDEGIVRWENAKNGLEKLQNNVDTVIVVQNDLLLDLVPDMPLNSAFKYADEILVNAVKGITELVTEKGLVNLDFADVKTIMQNGGVAMIGLGETESQENIDDAAKKALENPLLDLDITGAKNALINITGGEELSLKSAKIIMKTVAQRLDPSAKIIWGARIDESMGSSIRVMLIVTCLNSSKPSASEIEIALKETQPSFEPDKEASLEDEHSEEVRVVEESDASDHASKVFSEIFSEEAETDLAVMEEAINGLVAGDYSVNEKNLKEFSNACSSIYSSAELFDYKKISEFTELLGELIKSASEGKFNLSGGLLDLFRQIPPALRSVIENDENDQRLEAVMLKMCNVLDLLSSSPDSDVTSDVERTLAESPDQDAKGSEQESEEPKYSNVKEAVKYFDKLL